MRHLMIGLLLGGCGTDSVTNGDGDEQTPPQGAQPIEAWLADGAYKTWHAEPAVHEARSPSPHGFNRIYSNAAIANNVDGTGAWPSGAAAVKELYATITATQPSGVAVYVKVAADSAGGANWYWYERFGDGAAAADGKGVAGCVGCHAGAGLDAAHTPTPGGRDFVYTPVR